MRGDRPDLELLKVLLEEFTPHARGSTTRPGGMPKAAIVYPACAGIDPVNSSPNFSLCRLPRMRGDRPDNAVFPMYPIQFTPHARGSTFPICGRMNFFPVYPACAGIDRYQHRVVTL